MAIGNPDNEAPMTQEDINEATLDFVDASLRLIGRSGYVDGNVDLQMRVVSVAAETNRVSYKMGWIHNGGSYEVWFDAWRVTLSLEPRQKGRFSLTE